MGLGPLQKAWVDALRANPDEQLTGRLGDLRARQYCCLGKLCVLDAKINPNTILESDPYHNLFANGNDSLLPKHLVEKYGFKDDCGTFNAFSTSYMGNHENVVNVINTCSNEFSPASLIMLNDNGVTWPEIANFIEEFSEIIFNKEI